MPATVRIDFDVHADSISAALETELGKVKGITSAVNTAIESGRSASINKIAAEAIKEEEKISKEATRLAKEANDEQRRIAKAFKDYEDKLEKEHAAEQARIEKELHDEEMRLEKEAANEKKKREKEEKYLFDLKMRSLAAEEAEEKKLADEQKRLAKEVADKKKQEDREAATAAKQQAKELAAAQKKEAKEISDYEKLQEKERLAAIKEREKQEAYLFKLRMKSIADANKAEEKADRERLAAEKKANEPKSKEGSGGIGLAGGLGIGAAIAGFTAIKAKAEEADKANDELNTGLAATGLTGKRLAEENKIQTENAKKLSNDYKGISEEAAKSTIAMIAEMSHKKGDELKALSEDAIILAHGDSEKAIAIGKMLGKASNDEIEASASKLGIALDKNMSAEQRAATIHEEAMKRKKAVQDADNDSLGSMQQIMNKVMTTVTTLASTLLDALKPTFDAIIPLVDQLGALLSSTLGPVLASITPVVTMVASSFAKLAPPITALVSTALDALAPILQLVMDLLSEIMPVITDVVKVVLESMTPVFKALTPILEDLTSIFKAVFMQMLKGELIPIIKDVLVPILTDLLIPVLTSLMPLIKMITDIMMKVMVPAFTIVGDIMKWFSDSIVQPLVKWLSGALLKAFQDVVDWVMKAIEAIKSIASAIGSLLGLGGEEAKAAVKQTNADVVAETEDGLEQIDDVENKHSKKKGAAKKEEHKKELADLKAWLDEQTYLIEKKNAQGLLSQEEYDKEIFTLKESAIIKERDLWSKNSVEFKQANERLLQLRREFELKELTQATQHEKELQKMLSDMRIEFSNMTVQAYLDEDARVLENKKRFIAQEQDYETYQLDLKNAAGKLTEQQYQDELYKIKLEALKKQLAIFDIQSEAYRSTLDAITQLERQHTIDLLKVQTDGATKFAEALKTQTDQVGNFASGISDVLKQVNDLHKAENSRNKDLDAQLDKQLAKLDKQTQSKLKLAKTDKERDKINADAEKEQNRLIDANEKKQKEASEQGQQLSIADKIANLAKAASGMVNVIVGIMSGATELGPFGILAAPALIGAAIAMFASAKSTFGFRDGGFTGNGDPSQPAGTVHKNEFVLKSGSFAVDSNGNLVSVAGMGGNMAPVVNAIDKQTETMTEHLSRSTVLNQRRMVLENKASERSRSRERV